MTSQTLLDGIITTGKTFREFWADPEYRTNFEKIGGKVPLLGNIAHDAEPARAVVNFGRWITVCPQPRCAGTGAVWIDGPHQFMCMLCGNRGIDQKWRLVLVPPDWRTIEAVLILRVTLVDRNWVPTETIDDLLVENLSADYDVPPDLMERATVAHGIKQAIEDGAERLSDGIESGQIFPGHHLSAVVDNPTASLLG